MFWKYNSPSSVQIDALLQQENVSLQDLMDEEELLQECISQNKKVIDYLTQPETLEALVSFLVTDPSPDRELKVRFKYANLASELLTSDVPAIVDKVASSTNLLQMLYKFLEKEKPLNPLLASFVSKVFGMLVQRRSEQNWYSYQFTCFQVLDFLKSQGDFVEVAVRHIGTSAIMDLLSKLICGVDDDDQEIKQGIHQWLNECHLIEQLIEKLSPDCDSEEHSSVDQLLCELATKGQDTSTNGGLDSQPNGSQSRLLATLESKEIINKLMDTLLHEDRNESSVSHVINILLTLLSYKGSHKQYNLHTNSLNSIGTELDSRSSVLRTIVARLPDLQKILKQPTKLGKLVTSYGTEVERLGSTRLKVVSLIASLIATDDFFVHSEMAALGTLQLLFELFFKFSLNNFLHTQVTHCIDCIVSKSLYNDEGKVKEIDGLNNNPQKLENGEEVNEDEINLKEGEDKREIGEDAKHHPLLIQLFTECNIIQKILECYIAEEEAAATEKRLHNMVGYMGHIREMANNIVQFSKEGPSCQLIQEQIKKLPNDVITEWEEFTLIGLAEVNLKNKVIPLQMPGVTHRDSEEDSEEEFYPVESVFIMNKGFKEGDMDTLGDLRFVDAEDGFGSGNQRLGTNPITGVSCGQEMNIDEGDENPMDKFEKMCSDRKVDIHMFDDMWKDKEKNITFEQNAKNEEDNHHSSSEEEGDLDDEFDSIRAAEEEKRESAEWMWKETGDWSDVFDKRGNVINKDSGFNPWQSAPASETDSNSWADFGTMSNITSDSGMARNNARESLRFQHAAQGSSSFAPIAENIENTTPQAAVFGADFSKAFFSDSDKDIAMRTPIAFSTTESESASSFIETENTSINVQSESLSFVSGNPQDVCDATKMVASPQQDVVFSEEMESIETSQTEEKIVPNVVDDKLFQSSPLVNDEVVQGEKLDCDEVENISEETSKDSETSLIKTEEEACETSSEMEIESETKEDSPVVLPPPIESMDDSSLEEEKESMNVVTPEKASEIKNIMEN